MLAEGKQYVCFVDPKGLRNLEGLDDPKIRFHRDIKAIESRLADPMMVLNSFIISTTPSATVSWWNANARAELEKCHVLFQNEDKNGYIGKMLRAIVGDNAADAS